MKCNRLKRGKRKGVVLIISVGVLALVAMIATSFAINMQVEYKASINYLNSARATAIAQAGIDQVIADIRGWVADNSYSTVLSNITTNYPNPPTTEMALGDGYYQITIDALREDQKININALDETDSEWIKALNDNGLIYNDIAKIIDYRDMDTNQLTYIMIRTGPQSVTSSETNAKNAPYATVEEVRLVLNDDTKYNNIKNLITVNAPIIRGGVIGKYFSHRPSGFDKDFILELSNYKGKVIELGTFRQPLDFNVGSDWFPYLTFPSADGGNGWPESHDSEFAGAYIAADWDRVPGLFGLDQLGVIWTGFIYIPQANVNQTITFKVRSENGFKVIIDNTTIVEDWSDRTEIGGWTNPPSGNTTFAYAGWHPLRIDYYNSTGQNLFELKWNAFGNPADYIPPEYLGYQPASYYGDIYDDVAHAYKTPTTLGSDYNSAGIFKITSKGRVKRSDGTLLAEKQITTVVKLFNTWTQTTRAEFYAPWYTTYFKTKADYDAAILAGNGTGNKANFSEGAIRNVTWMDSCPTDTDSWNSTTHKMHWEESYSKVPDSLKLGYWNDFDEDVGYSTVTLKGGKQTTIDSIRDMTTFSVTVKGKTTTYTVPWHYNYTDSPPGTYTVSFGEIGAALEGANGTHNLNVYCPAYQERYAELNSYYYSPGLLNGSQDLGYDVFVRAYMQDDGHENEVSGNVNWWRSAISRFVNPPTNSIPTAEWCEAHLFMKCPPWNGSAPAYSYFTQLKSSDPADIYLGDENALGVNGAGEGNVAATYPMDTSTKVTNPYVLAGIGVGTSYTAYYSYLTTNNGAFSAANWVQAQSRTSSPPSTSTDTGVVQFNNCNMYGMNIDFWDKTALSTIYTRGAKDNSLLWYGAHVDAATIFDNIRIIYPKGFLISTPFAAKYYKDSANQDNANITWGTVSWTADTSATALVTMYTRKATPTFPTTDSGWTTATSSGVAVGGTEPCIQYKALLATTALSPTNYTNSSATPVLRDVTITYVLPLEILYRK